MTQAMQRSPNAKCFHVSAAKSPPRSTSGSQNLSLRDTKSFTVAPLRAIGTVRSHIALGGACVKPFSAFRAKSRKFLLIRRGSWPIRNPPTNTSK